MESEWKLKLTPLARTDLEEIYQYISICLDAPQAADRLMTAFEKSFEQLQNHPFSFPRADDESLRKKGYRKLIVENYVGAYLLNEQTKEVVVMRFFYGARDYTPAVRRKNEDAGAERHLHLLFCEKGGGKIDTRKRITIRLPQDVYRDILDNLGNAASSTFNSFMTNAARFYLGYIKARETEDYLSKTLLSIISARQERSDKATVSVLYALAVELNILQRILVSHFDIPDEVYAELRRKARAEVAVSRKGAQIESVQAQMFGGDTGWQSSSQNGAI